jgi:predicted metal-dependent HD superfamily phosphohydrolase
MERCYELAIVWQQLWVDRSSGAPDRSQQQEIDRILKLLIAAYTRPDRYYHNLAHLHHVLTVIDRFNVEFSSHSERLQDPSSVILAAWFHDFVYDPQAADNETQSARSAKELLINLVKPLEIDRIERLILATQGHRIDPNDADLCIFLDADLAILGTDPSCYAAYRKSIRREYNWVDDATYRTGRSRVLTSFLERDRLYYTDLLFGELESRARLNLQQEIALLEDNNSNPLDIGLGNY